MNQITEKFTKKIKELQQEIAKLSKNSKLSDADWLEKMRLKEEEFQKNLQDANRRHIEELQEAEAAKQKALNEMRKEWEGKMSDLESNLNS